MVLWLLAMSVTPSFAQNCSSQRDYELGLKHGLKMAPPCEAKASKDTNEWFIVPIEIERATSYILKPKCEPTSPPSEYIKALIGIGSQYSAEILQQVDGKPTEVIVKSERGSIRWVKGMKNCQSLIDKATNRIDAEKNKKFQDAEKFK